MQFAICERNNISEWLFSQSEGLPKLSCGSIPNKSELLWLFTAFLCKCTM